MVGRSTDDLLVVEPLRVGGTGPGSAGAAAAAGAGGSDWEGVPGAALICDGLIVGVQRHHQNPIRPGSLEAVRFARFADDAGLCDVLRRRGIPTGRHAQQVLDGCNTRDDAD